MKALALISFLFFSVSVLAYDFNHGLQLLQEKRDTIIGIELVIAGKGAASYSRFGHALMRFVDNDSDPLNDIMIGYVADTGTEQASMLKGIFGGYEAITEIKVTEEYWRIYTVKENRPLNRIIIPTTQEMRQTLISNLLNQQGRPKEDYKFFSKNCSSLLHQFLKEHPAFVRYTAVFNSDKNRTFKRFEAGSNVIIPDNLISYAQETGLSPYPTLKMDADFDLKKQTALQLGVHIQKLFDQSTWDDASKSMDLVSVFRNHFSIDQLKRLSSEFGFLIPLNVRRALFKGLYLKRGKTLDEIVGVKKVSPVFYQLCEDQDCAESVQQSGASTFGDFAWKKISQNWKKTYLGFQYQVTLSPKQMVPVIYNPETDDLFENHYRLLSESLEH